MYWVVLFFVLYYSVFIISIDQSLHRKSVSTKLRQLLPVNSSSYSHRETCPPRYVKFVRTCWCQAGWNGLNCSEKLASFDDCICEQSKSLGKRCTQLCLFNNQTGITRASNNVWQRASDLEYKAWKGIQV